MTQCDTFRQTKAQKASLTSSPLRQQNSQPITVVPPKEEYTVLNQDFGKTFGGQGRIGTVLPGPFHFVTENISHSCPTSILIPPPSLPTAVRKRGLWRTHTTSRTAVCKGLNYNQHRVTPVQAVLRERPSSLTARQSPRSGPTIRTRCQCVNKHSAQTQGTVVLNSDFTVKRLWVQIPGSLLGTLSRLPNGSKSSVLPWAAGIIRAPLCQGHRAVGRDDTCQQRTS